MLKSFTKQIDRFFNWLYSLEGYYALKSGLYLDHYFKKFFSWLHKEINYFVGIIFMDSYILNTLTNKFYTNLAKFNEKILNLKKTNNLVGVKITVFIVLLMLFLLTIIFV